MWEYANGVLKRMMESADEREEKSFDTRLWIGFRDWVCATALARGLVSPLRCCRSCYPLLLISTPHHTQTFLAAKAYQDVRHGGRRAEPSSLTISPPLPTC